MRDNSEGMPEIVDAYERDGEFFGVVQVVFEGTPHAFEFAVREMGYRALRRILGMRPYDPLDQRPYRYFFCSGGFIGEERKRGRYQVRIEQACEGREFEVDGPVELFQNLFWFLRLKRIEDASHLREVQRPLAAP